MRSKKKIIGIIDYKMGNIGSVASALKYLQLNFLISSDIKSLSKTDALILPGVGAFPQGMENIRKFMLDKFLIDEVKNKQKPFLGICLGMQLLADSSEENCITKGLGFISGKVLRMKSKKKFQIPHVGWNNINFKTENKLIKNLTNGDNFYFDHSYKFVPTRRNNLKATSNHGEKFAAIVSHKNIYGTQFHPEKSQRNGLKLLRNFSNLA